MNDNDAESNRDLVELAADNIKLAFQTFAYAEGIKVSLTNEFTDKLNQYKEHETKRDARTDKNY